MQFASLSDIGQVRQNNEDYIWVGINKYHNFAGIICDGLGGYKGGSAASEIVVSLFKEQFENINFNSFTRDDIVNWINNVIKNARSKISEKITHNQNLKNMATTAVICIVVENKAYVFNIGDSRAWFVPNSGLPYQITKDQNLYNYLLKINAPPEIFEQHQDNLYAITQFIGATNSKQITPDCHELNIKSGDLIILTSDGCHNFIEIDQMVQIIKKEKKLQSSCNSIILNALANNSNDNLSIVIMEF